ncbi:GNAT family N-acetyltransferase [Halocalculus aciditolerans]|uniref:N-acetyltransferase domain-containing protein n=1 Tax=Halocalculus aciditolerans TaxID=1383812 RepID=A0A830FH96_9EURY|nr:GNAT family N-acetyltransferase [Halocalculus aciditolerans]GGL55775.1 hypothetical protein GCM10009039_12470 [Halocalculus aciditolerans]
MEVTTYTADDGTTYRIRVATPSDAAEITALHSAVWGGDGTDAWFRWKYVENPYVDHVPALVAEHDDAIVAAFGLLLYRMRQDETTGLGALGGDLVVHPDHRRRGLFTQLSMAVWSFYAEERVDESERPDFVFGYQTEAARLGALAMGWRQLAERTTYRRTNDPTPFLADAVGPAAARALGPASRLLARGYAALRRRLAGTPRGVRVERRDDVPPGVLAGVADRARPAHLHPIYDEAFYDWQFTGPTWRPNATYLAYAGGDPDPVAAVLTRVEERGGARTVSLIHAAPLTGGDRWTRGLAAILDRVVADSRDAAFLRAWNPVYPARLLEARGFLPDDRPPLSLVTGSDLTLTAYAFHWGRFDGDDLPAAADALWTLDK